VTASVTAAPDLEPHQEPTQPNQPTTTEAKSPVKGGGPRLGTGLMRALAVLIVAGVLGYWLGWLRGGEEIVRRELVYTLDNSVPDGFLREDRRLLTQLVTLQSDAVLSPVAEQFGLTTEDLRSKIEVETVDLSEVLGLEVRDTDRQRAADIGQAVLDEYLVLSSTPPSSESSEVLKAEQVNVNAQLEEAEASLKALRQEQQRDAQLRTTEESLERRIDLGTEQANRLQGLLDDALIRPTTNARRARIVAEQAVAEEAMTQMETELATVRAQRAALAERTTADPGLERLIARLEADLTTIDGELAQRDLGPIVASPIRLLSEPTFVTHSAKQSGVEGLATGLALGIPIAAWMVYRARARRHWLIASAP